MTGEKLTIGLWSVQFRSACDIFSGILMPYRQIPSRI